MGRLVPGLDLGGEDRDPDALTADLGERLLERLAQLPAADGLTLSAQRTRSTDSGYGYGYNEGNDL